MKIRFELLLLSLFLLPLLLGGTGRADSGKIVRVGVVVDGPWERNEPIGRLVREEIIALTSGEFEVRFPEDKYLVADWTLAGIRAALDQLLTDPAVDMVLTMGVVASHFVSHRGPLPKPVIAPFVLDVSLQALPRSQGGSGVKNLNYIALPSTLKRDVRAFLEITSFTKLTVLVNQLVYQAIPQFEERTSTALESQGVELRIVAVRTIEDALNALTDDVQAVYLAPLPNISLVDFERLVNKLIEKKIPSFSLLGRSEVERGILATVNPEIFPRIARRVALNLQRILLGEDPGDIPYAFTAGEELAINVTTSRAIGVYPDWGLITEAVLINEERIEVAQTWTLQQAVAEGVRVNLDVATKSREVAVGGQEVKAARANLLPQLDISATGVQIDEDRAGTFQAEKTLSGSARLTQVLYSDDAWTNFTVQKHLQRSLEQEEQTVYLDIAREIAAAYLQVLSTLTLESIQRENLKLSHSNLELARVRESVGYSGRAEVFRWESEIAINRKAVIDANALRNVAEIQFNRLLNRPLEEKFNTVETSLDETGLLSEQGRLFQYMNNRWAFKALRRFFVQEGLNNSPEIKQLDAAIAAQERVLRNTTRSLFLPDLVAQAEVSQIFSESGAGSEDFQIDPNSPLAPFAAGFDPGDNTNWSVALNLSFPLFNGGAKYALRGRAVETLARLRQERRALAEKIEQRVRSASHQAGASYAGIKQSRKAAEAAQENLELVVDAYSRGVLDIIQLLDAQNAALTANQGASNAVYEFLIDLMDLERSLGRLHVLRTPQERQDFFQRLDNFFAREGIEMQ